ncbi:polyamine aminopropyltransferase [Haloferula helveola]
MQRKRSPNPSASARRKNSPESRGADCVKTAENSDGIVAHPLGAAFWLMLGLSGFACLTYQILWMRQARLLFGSTSQAAALTLALFFGGLATGAWHWGRRSRHVCSPMRTYSRLEWGIALAGIIVLVAPAVVPRVYPLVGSGAALAAFKVIATLLMVFPASFLMGGTLPVLGQAAIRSRELFGTITARMYAVNTLGAACGAFATAFVFVAWFGLRVTCLTAMAISVVTALIARRLSHQPAFANCSEDASTKVASANLEPMGKPLPRLLLSALAFVSGFNLLALEVVWTRMLAQVHENSVYSFATVLIVVLTCLSLGAWLASRLARSGMPPAQVLLWLLALGGIALALTPLLSINITGNMTMLETRHTFTGYVLRLFGTGFATIGPACLPLGAVFPFLMKGEEASMTHAGKSIGRLAGINTIGAILGSLAAGFLLLEWLGLWSTVQVIASVYLVAAFITPSRASAASISARIASGVMLVVVFTALDPSKLPSPSGAEVAGPIVEKWEGSDGTVSVTGDANDPKTGLSIRINSNYSLGSTAAYGSQMFQARIPLLAWPDTDSVFFLGMGTGVTAGEALNRDDFAKVERVVACELSPDVVNASEKYFTGATTRGFDLTNGLFEDPRAEIIIGDGRNHLLANPERYSMIIADLFLPYRRGSGNLYSREHFRIVRDRLKPGGVFVQWLPLYQMSEREFGTIARTMIDVFPQVSLWRGNFQPGAEIAAMIGHVDSAPLPACSLHAERDKIMAVEGASHLDLQNLMLPINPQTITLFYGGDLSAAADLFSRYPLNTDDRPVIEFGTPRSLHQPADADRPQFLEARFAGIIDQLQQRTPPTGDPFLSSRSPSNRHLPLAGSAFHRAWIARVHDDEEQWIQNWETFLGHWLARDPGIPATD